MTIIPSSKLAGQQTQTPRRIFVQCAHHAKKSGLAFFADKCTLKPGRNDSELILRVIGERFHWHVDLKDAFAHGKEATVDQTRNAILAGWGGKSTVYMSSKPGIDDRWKRGPILQ